MSDRFELRAHAQGKGNPGRFALLPHRSENKVSRGFIVFIDLDLVASQHVSLRLTVIRTRSYAAIVLRLMLTIASSGLSQVKLGPTQAPLA